MAQMYLEEMFGLAGKGAVVTGGGGTLGSVIGAALARAGARVTLWDVRPEALAEKEERLARACGDAGRVHAVTVDLMEGSAIEEALAETVEAGGEVEILVNACGGNRGKCAMVDQKKEDYEYVLRLNLLAGCFLPMQVFARHWIGREIGGSVINIASMAGFVPLSGVWAYDAAKAAVMNQTIAAANELAPHGIRVNAIAPGFFLADQNRALLVDEKTGEPTARGREVLARTPFGRFGEPDELSGVCLLLASGRAAGFVSGAVIPVDGAYLCYSI